MATDTTLVLHSSRVRLVVQCSAPLALLALGVPGLVVTDAVVVPAVLLAFGVVMGGIVLFDLPLRCEFDGEGLTRVCMLRRHRLPWSTVVALERPPRPPRLRRGDDDGPPTATPGQGLIARTGPRRRHLLTDRRESHAEWTALRDLLRDRGTQLRAVRPPLEATPAGRGPDALHRS